MNPSIPLCPIKSRAAEKEITGKELVQKIRSFNKHNRLSRLPFSYDKYKLKNDLEINADGFLIVSNVLVKGEVNLNDENIETGVIFLNCEFDSHFQAIGSFIHSLNFWGCSMRSIDCYGIHTKHDLSFKSSDKYLTCIAWFIENCQCENR